MLKVQVKDPKSGFRMNLPIPYHLFIDLFVRESVVRKFALASIEREGGNNLHLRNFLENIDYTELRTSLHELAIIPGYTFVDVHSADGTMVKIINT